MTKNNVTRLLDSRKITYTPHELPKEKISALEAANLLGADPNLVFKTIVTLRLKIGKHILAVVPATTHLNLKALAKAVGEKKVRLSTQTEAENLTGLETGGISPLALINKGFQVVIDSSAKSHPQIYISGGQRGLNIQLNPGDLIKLTNARVSDITITDQ